MHKSFALLALITFAGCATNFEPKPLPGNHPANAQTEEAPRSSPRRLIAADELSRQSEVQLARKDVPNPDFQSGGMSHDMGDMLGMDHSKMQGMDMDKKPASAPVQEPSKMPGMDQTKMKEMPAPTAAIYTCTMHPEVNRPAPGKCPKCGMTLVKKAGGVK